MVVFAHLSEALTLTAKDAPLAAVLRQAFPQRGFGERRPRELASADAGAAIGAAEWQPIQGQQLMRFGV
jgi:hypothetical protein